MRSKSSDAWQNGKTPLDYASENGHKEVVKLTLKKGGKFDTDALSALHFAAENGHKAVVELLLRARGTKVDARDSDGLTPLMRAIASARRQWCSCW